MGAGAHAPAVFDVDTKSTQIRPTSRPGRRTKRYGPGRTGVPAFGRLPDERPSGSRPAEGTARCDRTERGPTYTAAAFVFLDKLSTVSLYLDGDPERTIDAAQPADLLEPTNMEHLDQPLFLLGHGVENPADGIHGDKEYLYVVELPARNPFEEPA